MFERVLEQAPHLSSEFLKALFGCYKGARVRLLPIGGQPSPGSHGRDPSPPGRRGFGMPPSVESAEPVPAAAAPMVRPPERLETERSGILPTADLTPQPSALSSRIMGFKGELSLEDRNPAIPQFSVGTLRYGVIFAAGINLSIRWAAMQMCCIFAVSVKYFLCERPGGPTHYLRENSSPAIRPGSGEAGERLKSPGEMLTPKR